MRKRIAPWISALVIGLPGCAGGPPRPVGAPVAEVYQEAAHRGTGEAVRDLKQGMRLQYPVGYPRPYVPVLSHPEVFSVYVLPHTTSGGKVSVQGHWVHMKLRGSRWWHEEEAPTYNLDRLGEGLPFKAGRAEQPAPPTPKPPDPRMEEIPKGDEER